MADSKKELHYLKQQHAFDQQYKSQHVSNGNDLSAANKICDMLQTQGLLAKIVPGYQSGKNPNFFDEYCSSIDRSDFTSTDECKKIVRDEYEQRRWSYWTHLMSYTKAITQEENRKLDKVEFWRRFQSKGPVPVAIRNWYFASGRKPGDVETCVEKVSEYIQRLTFLCPSFSNCPIAPMKNQIFGPMHVAVGFVDLGLLLDNRLQDNNMPFEFHGYESSPFAVAKTMVVWEMIKTPGIQARWIVQVWFSSSIWSKQATNRFLAAAHRVVNNERHCRPDDADQSPRVLELLLHWSKSRGVGLKKLIKRYGNLRRESSRALFFANKCDRMDMIRYHLTGAFGLLGDVPCSGSILMFDKPNWARMQANSCVFQTFTISDIVSSEHWNGKYFHTAEIVKEQRMEALVDHARAGWIKVRLKVSTVSTGSQAISDIFSLRPQSVSWPNVLDYMKVETFHRVAKACSPNAYHFGYSMNWAGYVFGTSLIDFPKQAMGIIQEAEEEMTYELKKLCRRFNRRRIFLTPMQPEQSAQHRFSYACQTLSFFLALIFFSCQVQQCDGDRSWNVGLSTKRCWQRPYICRLFLDL